MSERGVGRNNLLVKGRDIPGALARILKKPTNNRSSHSGRGCKVSARRKERLGLSKAALDSRLIGGGLGLAGGYGLGKLVDYLRDKDSGLPVLSALLGAGGGALAGHAYDKYGTKAEGEAGGTKLPADVEAPATNGRKLENQVEEGGGHQRGTGSATGDTSSSSLAVDDRIMKNITDLQDRFVFDENLSANKVINAVATGQDALFKGYVGVETAKHAPQAAKWVASKLTRGKLTPDQAIKILNKIPGASKFKAVRDVAGMAKDVAAMSAKSRGGPVLNRLLQRGAKGFPTLARGGKLLKRVGVMKPILGAMAVAEPGKEMIEGYSRREDAGHLIDQLRAAGVPEEQLAEAYQALATYDPSTGPDGVYGQDKFRHLTASDRNRQAMEGALAAKLAIPEGQPGYMDRSNPEEFAARVASLRKDIEDRASSSAWSGRAYEALDTGLAYNPAFLPLSVGMDSARDLGYLLSDIGQSAYYSATDPTGKSTFGGLLGDRLLNKGRAIHDQYRAAGRGDSAADYYYGAKTGLTNPLMIQAATHQAKGETEDAYKDMWQSERDARAARDFMTRIQEMAQDEGKLRPQDVTYDYKSKNPAWMDDVNWQGSTLGSKEDYIREALAQSPTAAAGLLYGRKPEDLGFSRGTQMGVMRDRYGL